jgi:transcriptional regulator with XRE-family HTH domain
MDENPLIEKEDRLLAERLMAARRDAKLTLDEAAAASGVSRATLSRIERAETSPTASTLGRLCAAYRLTMSELLSVIEADQPRIITREQAPFWEDRNTGFRRWAISPPAEGYGVELVWGELPAKARIAYETPPVAGIEHHFVVFQGVLQLTAGSSVYTLQRHDCLRMKVCGPCVFENPGTSVARYLIALKRKP